MQLLVVELDEHDYGPDVILGSSTLIEANERMILVLVHDKHCALEKNHTDG